MYFNPSFEPDFFEQLRSRLVRPLPGFAAHQQMLGPERLATYQDQKPDEKTRRSAVLILFYSSDNQWFMPMIVRQPYDGVHGGQVGFPGGKQETGDENLTQTALREAHEEVGVEPSAVVILGHLSELFVVPSNLMLLPVVGFMGQRPDFKPDSREVKQVLEIPLRELADIGPIQETEILLGNGAMIKAPYYPLQQQVVWGASAMVISELITVLAEAN